MIRICDGDTVVLHDGRHVRYIGINAPEIAHKDQPAEPFGYAAKRLNERLTLNQIVRLSTDKERKDRYGRLLAYVFLADGTLVNAEMLYRGYAHVRAQHPNVAYEQALLSAQQEAMSAGRGFWGHWKAAKGRYIGNRRSKRFHLAACPFGQRTGPSNRIRFARVRDAFWHGYAPCQKCGAWTFHALAPSGQ